MLGCRRGIRGIPHALEPLTAHSSNAKPDVARCYVRFLFCMVHQGEGRQNSANH